MKIAVHRPALGAALTLIALAGCDTGGGSGAAPAVPASPSASPSVAPRDALRLAVPGADEVPYKFAVTGNQTPLSGVVDGPHDAMQALAVNHDPDIGLEMTMNTLIVADGRWVRISFEPDDLPGLPTLPRKWLKLDPAKLDDGDDRLDVADPGYTGLLVANAAEVKSTGGGGFTGTTDLTRSTEADIVSAAELKALGARAKAAPFTAKVDDAGRLTALTVRIPAAGKSKARTYSVSYIGHGSTKAPAVPAAGEQTKAPAVVYEMLNG